MSRKINEIGNVYGDLLVIDAAPSIRGKAAWLCQCSCGKQKVYTGDGLRRGMYVSCAECGIKKRRMHEIGKLNKKDLTGLKMGKLTAIEPVGSTKYGGVLWKCLCDCGNYHMVESSNFTKGRVLSCGCLKSKGELFIKEILKEKGVDYKTQFYEAAWRLSSGYHPYFDFAVFLEERLVCLIEYHGEQHYGFNKDAHSWNSEENFEKTKRRDQEKINIARKEGIPLYIIAYNENLKDKLFEILHKENLI